jgi:RNA polymerase-binding transcription factor DksA
MSTPKTAVNTRSANRSKLSHSRQEALEELSHLQQELMSEVDMEVDEADEQITEHETAAILITMLENRVRDIDHALAAIKVGHYEKCERCGRSIEPQRLAAKPDARLCIACQEAVDAEAHS